MFANAAMADTAAGAAGEAHGPPVAAVREDTSACSADNAVISDVNMVMYPSFITTTGEYPSGPGTHNFTIEAFRPMDAALIEAYEPSEAAGPGNPPMAPR